MESPRILATQEQPHKILITSPKEDSQDEKGIEIFKSFDMPNLEKIILSSQSLYTDFLNFEGKLWNNQPFQHPKHESNSSVPLEETSPGIIILHKMSEQQGSISASPSKPKKLRSSKSFAPAGGKSPFLQIEDDVQPQVANIRHNLIENSKRTSIDSQAFQLSSILSPQSIEYLGKSFENKDISAIPGLLDSDCEDEIKENAPSLNRNQGKKMNSEVILNHSRKFSVSRQEKARTVAGCTRIPELFEINRNSDIVKMQKDKKRLNKILETFPDVNSGRESVNLEEEKRPNSGFVKDNSDSLEPLCRLIPRAILYQIPILTFEEFISTLLNDKITYQKGILWTVGRIRRLVSACFCNSLNKEDFTICERIIGFNLSSFSFQNSLHLILLMSCYKSVSHSDTWPHKEQDWYDIGFNSGNIEEDLKVNGTISLLHIFFLSSYFPGFYEEMLRVRSYYSYNLYEIIASISEITMTILRKNKLNALIKANGRAPEVIFFFFAGVMLYWFKKLIKSKDYLQIYDSTVKKASKKMNELLKDAWKEYLDSKNVT